MANTKCSYCCVRHCALLYARQPDARCSHAPCTAAAAKPAAGPGMWRFDLRRLPS